MMEEKAGFFQGGCGGPPQLNLLSSQQDGRDGLR